MTKDKQTHRCLRCNRDFESSQDSPARCTLCKSDYWDRAPAKNQVAFQKREDS